jgi:hypothetical protein
MIRHEDISTFGCWGVLFEELKGKVLVDIRLDCVKNGNEALLFVCDDGTKYAMFHFQDCCESVSLEDFDLQQTRETLLNTPILEAIESSNSGNQEGDGTFTWTFYKLATKNGWIDIRWYGASNGYYSESVELYRIGQH